MDLTVTGRIKVIEPTKQVSDKFAVRPFVITLPDEKYPQDIAFQLAQDKCKLIDSYKAGDELIVKFNLRGREYNGKYYNTLEAWSILSTPVSHDSTDDTPF